MSSTQQEARFTIICIYCNRHVLARESWIGRDVRCPHCSGVLRVPEGVPGDPPVRARQPAFGANRYFNFACGRCKALLETHTGMCGQPGRCPTCAANFTIPYVDPDSGLPEGEAHVEDDGENPTPMHAYAASGGQAPQIVVGPDKISRIECPRCHGVSPIDADACAACGVPFTIDAAPSARDADVRTKAIAASVLGALALASPLTPLFLVAGLIGAALGVVAIFTATKTVNLVMGLGGLAGALIGGVMFLYFR